jgi:outer membrane protein assembly factor BamD (BamD/ComL family)
MSLIKKIIVLLISLTFLLLPAYSIAQELEKRLLESGKTFLKEGKYQLALEDFNTLIRNSPDSPYADDAQLLIAKYYLEIEEDYDRAMEGFNKLIKEFAGTDSAEAAYFYIGHVNLTKGETQEEFNEALANFERIARLYPQSQWVDDALLNSALSYERLKDYNRAIEKLNTLMAEYPEFEHITKAYLLKARFHVYLGNYNIALLELQELRNNYADSPDANKALNMLTLIYRLTIKPKVRNEPIYNYDADFKLKMAENIKNARSVIINNQRDIFIADGKREAVLQFTPEGDYNQQFFIKDPQSIFIDENNKLVANNKKGILIEKQFSNLIIETEEGPKEVEEAMTVVKDSYARYIVADKKSKQLLYFDKNFKYLSSISNAFFREFTDLAINSKDQIWVLEKKDKSVQQFNLKGKTLHKIMPRGKGYELEEPVDITLDISDNLYVLDKKQKKIFIFNPLYDLLGIFSLTNSSGSQLEKPLLIAVDEAGGLYVFDDKVKNLLRYF